jgi:hypothetical protein
MSTQPMASVHSKGGEAGWQAISKLLVNTIEAKLVLSKAEETEGTERICLDIFLLLTFHSVHIFRDIRAVTAILRVLWWACVVQQ